MANLLQLTPHSFATTSDNHVRKATPSMAFGPMVLQSKLCAKVTRCYSSKLEAAPSRHAKRRSIGAQSDSDFPVRSSHSTISVALAATLLLAGPIMPPVTLADEVATVFTRSCAGCHAGGGNVVQANKTLKQPDLEANGLATLDAIYEVIYSGKNKMPGFGEGCAPKGSCTFAARLSDDVIRQLAQYTLDQAHTGWQP